MNIAPQRTGVVAVFITGGDHQTEPKNGCDRMVDEILLARIADAAGKALGYAEPLLGRAQ